MASGLHVIAVADPRLSNEALAPCHLTGEGTAVHPARDPGSAVVDDEDRRFDLRPLHDTKHASAPGNNPNNNH